MLSVKYLFFTSIDKRLAITQKAPYPIHHYPIYAKVDSEAKIFYVDPITHYQFLNEFCKKLKL
jgi:hypothetical protein